MRNERRAVIIGGGPAGLRAAEVLAEGGLSVDLFDGKSSVGRKFLVAGRGGLNLTHSEPLDRFVTRYGNDTKKWEGLLDDFSPSDMRAWAAGLGIETYIGTSGRIFPVGQQAAPLLRRWVKRLKESGVRFHRNARLENIVRSPGLGVRLTKEGSSFSVEADVVVMALGGGSWPETGSDGGWVKMIRGWGVDVRDLKPANCGYESPWTPEFRELAEGQPVKNITVGAGGVTVVGELLVTTYGLEGGALYQLSRVLREMEHPAIEIDFKPTFSVEELVAKVHRQNGEDLFTAVARAWKLGGAAVAFLRSGPEGMDVTALAAMVKKFHVAFTGPRPIAEAISSAGGVAWEEVDANLMLHKLPGVFVAGEMIDWEAPTGGYLLQGCLATGTRAALGAARTILR